jgi:hypothetical protein
MRIPSSRRRNLFVIIDLHTISNFTPSVEHFECAYLENAPKDKERFHFLPFYQTTTHKKEEYVYEKKCARYALRALTSNVENKNAAIHFCWGTIYT